MVRIEGALCNIDDRYWKIIVNIEYIICSIKDNTALRGQPVCHGRLAEQTSVGLRENFIDKI